MVNRSVGWSGKCWRRYSVRWWYYSCCTLVQVLVDLATHLIKLLRPVNGKRKPYDKRWNAIDIRLNLTAMGPCPLTIPLLAESFANLLCAAQFHPLSQ